MLGNSYYTIPGATIIQLTPSKTSIFNDINSDANVSKFIPMSKLSSLLFNEADICNEPSIFITGFNENQLEILDDIVYNVTSKNINTIILNENFRNKQLKELLNKSFLSEFDHVLPEKKYITLNPFVLFHSLNVIEIKKLMKSLRLLFNDNTDNIVFAVVVKNSLEKVLNTLIDEVFEDYNGKKLI